MTDTAAVYKYINDQTLLYINQGYTETEIANIILPGGNYVLRVKNGVLLYQKDVQADDADVTWITNRMGLLSIIQKNPDGVAALITQEGDTTYLTRLMDAVTAMADYRFFNIIEP